MKLKGRQASPSCTPPSRCSSSRRITASILLTFTASCCLLTSLLVPEAPTAAHPKLGNGHGGIHCWLQSAFSLFREAFFICLLHHKCSACNTGEFRYILQSTHHTARSVSSLTPPRAGAGNRGISVLLVSAWATKAAYVNLVSPLVSPLASLASGQTAMGAVAGSMAVHCKTDMAPVVVRQRVALAPMPCGNVAGRFMVRS
jgi:hypothetical protein